MRIVYISQYYPPEIGAPAARVSELARAWAAQGHEVTVLTAFPHHPHGQKRREDRGVLTRREFDGDVQLVRTYVFAAKNAGFLWRVLSYLSFMVSAILIGTWRVGRADVVIATSPQLFTGIAGWWISKIKRAPFIFEVRDLWPESIVTVGAMRESFAIRVLKGLAAWLYRVADRIVTVGDGYARRIIRDYAITPEKLSTVTNGVDLTRFQFDETMRANPRMEHGWQEKFVVLYLGTHGMAHGLDTVLTAAQSTAPHANIHYVFIGDGAEKANLEQKTRTLQLTNVTFLPACDKEKVVGYYAAADVCLVPLRKVDLFTDVLPSKMFEIMAMRRPIVLSVDGDARRVLEAARAGVFVEPENSVRLADSLVELSRDPLRCARFGENGRDHVEQFYSRKVLANKYLTLLQEIRFPHPTKAAKAAKATSASQMNHQPVA